MIREPLSPSDTSATVPNRTHSALATVWVAIGFAILFLLLAIYHSSFLLRTKAWFTWTLVAASIIQCISLIANAYDMAYPASAAWYALEGVVFPLAPTLTMIACIQTFGRAAWHSLLSNAGQSIRLRGFLISNTWLFVTLMLVAYILMLIGNITVVAIVYDAISSSGDNARRIKAAYGIVESGLILQTILLLISMLLVWRWKYVSGDWEVEWDGNRRARWTWKALLRIILVGAGLLLVRQAYILARFFSALQGLRWLHFVLDVLPLFATLTMLAVWHPGRCLSQEVTSIRLNLPQPASERQTGVETSVEKQPGSSSSETDTEKQ